MASMKVLITMFMSICFINTSTTAATPKECETPICKMEARRMEALMNTTVDPCQDFSQYACGTFFKNAKFLPGRQVVGSLANAQMKDFLIFKQLLTDPVIYHKKGKDSYEWKMKTYYNACMNTDAIEDWGLKDYKESFRLEWPTLNQKWMESSFTDLTTITSKYLNMFVYGLFMFSETLDDSPPVKRYVLKIDRPWLFLQPYILDKARNSTPIVALETYYTGVAVALGADKKTAECDAEDIVDFLWDFNKMIKAAKKKYPNPTNSTLQEMNQRFPYLDWVSTFNAAFKVMGLEIDPSQEFDIPAYFNDLGDFLKKYDKMVIQNYFGFKHARRVVFKANKEMNQLNDDFKKTDPDAYGGDKMSRDRYCVDDIDIKYNFGLAKLLSRIRFNHKAEVFVENLIGDVKAAYKNSLEKMPWMGKATKQKALLKLEKMTHLIGVQKKEFGDDDLDQYYKDFVVKGSRYNANAYQNEDQHSLKNMQQVNKLAEKWRWDNYVSMAGVNAHYRPKYNQITFGLGAMQEPLFGQENPSYMNYGSLGFLIGHEIGHGFGVKGRDYDEDGFKQDWWTEEDSKKFKERTQCFRKQYSNFKAEKVDLYINGSTTLIENLSDHLGTIEAYKAYKAHVKRNGPDLPLPGLQLTDEKLFFLSTAQTWCMKYTPEATKRQIEGGWTHPPPNLRIIGMMQNSKDFSKAFNCGPGDYMNPAQKCSLW